MEHALWKRTKMYCNLFLVEVQLRNVFMYSIKGYVAIFQLSVTWSKIYKMKVYLLRI